MIQRRSQQLRTNHRFVHAGLNDNPSIAGLEVWTCARKAGYADPHANPYAENSDADPHQLPLHDCADTHADAYTHTHADPYADTDADPHADADRQRRIAAQYGCPADQCRRRSGAVTLCGRRGLQQRGQRNSSSSATISTAGQAHVAPMAVYQDVRWNSSFTYTLPGLTAGQNYVVYLHFVELSFTAAGDRLFQRCD